jgi:homoserine/homoserine lactone efflux protein
MLSNSIANGSNKATATAGGDLSANLLQMIAASIGLVSILTQFQQVFVFIKWAGVACVLSVHRAEVDFYARTRFGEHGC